MAAIVCCQSRLHATMRNLRKKEMKKFARNFHCQQTMQHFHISMTHSEREIQKSWARQLKPKSSAVAATASRRQQRKKCHQFFFVFDRFSAGFFYSFASIFDGNDIESNRNMVFKWFSSFSFGKRAAYIADDIAVCFSFYFFSSFLHQEWNCFWLM